ncbi:MAG: hypothetical protein ACP5LF_06355 [Nitrososphaeria archaeon]
MGSLGKTYLENGEEIEVLDTFALKVISKIPYALWEATVPLSLSKAIYDINIGSAVLKVFYNGKPILQSFVELFNKQLNLGNNYVFKIIVPIQALQFIEAQRQDDVMLEFQIVGTLIYQQNIPQTKALKQFSLSFNQTYSQKNWLNLLRETGYSDKWIIEIDRPKIEGFYEVTEFIEKAGNGLLENASPDSIISDLRSAWDKLDPYLKKYDQLIKEEINKRSQKEENEPQKDERINEIMKYTNSLLEDIQNLKKRIDKLTQIGPHKEIYSVTREDALLAYRLTVSLISYYSKIIKEVSQKENLEK